MSQAPGPGVRASLAAGTRRWWRWSRARDRRARYHRDADRGAAPIELAILWPAVVLLLFGAVQVCTYFTARSVALSGAQVAVSTARQYDTTQPEQAGQDRAETFLAQAGDWLVDWEIEGPERDEEAGEVTATVRGEALTLVPGYSWEIEQTARGEIERFTEP